MTDLALTSTEEVTHWIESPERAALQMLQRGEQIMETQYAGLNDVMELYCRPGTGNAWCPSNGRCINTALERCEAPPYVIPQTLDPCVRQVMGVCDMYFQGAAGNACRQGVVNSMQPAGIQPPTPFLQSMLLFPGPFSMGKSWGLEVCTPSR